MPENTDQVRSTGPTTHNLSLSRWHKIAERLSREFTETVGSTRTTLAQSEVSAYLGEEQESFLLEQSTNALDNLQFAFEIQDALVRIRQAVGDANVHTGVSSRLAEFDSLNRRIKVLSELVSSQNIEMVTPGQLRNLPRDYVADGSHYDSRRPKIRVRMATTDQLEALQRQLNAVRKRAYALSDEIAQRNQAQVSIALDSRMTALAGL